MPCIDFMALGYSRSEIEALIDEWILSERDRAIMKRKHIDGVKFEPLAEEFDMSVRQIKKVVYENDLKMHEKCTKIAR